MKLWYPFCLVDWFKRFQGFCDISTVIVCLLDMVDDEIRRRFVVTSLFAVADVIVVVLEASLLFLWLLVVELASIVSSTATSLASLASARTSATHFVVMCCSRSSRCLFDRILFNLC